MTPDADDWVSANWLMARHFWLWRRFIITALVAWLIYSAILIGGLALEYGWSGYWALITARNAAGYTLVLIAAFLAIFAFTLPRRTRKQWADVQRLATGSDIECDHAGIRTRNAIGSVSLEWTQFKRLLENDRVLALMITEREMILIPKGQLPEPASKFIRSCLADAGVESHRA